MGALPVDDASVFIRARLDQGKRRPLELLPGHRTATILQRVDFEARQAARNYTSFWVQRPAEAECGEFASSVL